MLEEQQPRAFASILTLREADNISLDQIIDASIRACKIGIRDFRSPARFTHYVKARHIYFYLAHKITGRPFPIISRLCGDRDHTTAIHGFKSVERDPGKYEPELTQVKMALGQAMGG